MDATTRTTLKMTKTLAAAGLHVPGVRVETADGRIWEIQTVPPGRGRHADGHWGKKDGAPGGFRLFEIDEERETMDEHDNDEHDTWYAEEVAEYLREVGQRKSRN